MNDIKDIKGQKFGMVTAVAFSHIIKGTGAFWHCVCDCGREKVMRGSALRSGESKSCGCERLRKIRLKKLTHGHTVHGMSPEYSTWASMKARCNPVSGSVNYAGRGISVCERWSESFEAFFEDMGRKPSPVHSIERIDNDGNYEPSNCKWATREEQQNNTRRNRMVVRSDGMIFRTPKQAAQYVGCDDSFLGKVLKGKKRSAKGFTWKYLYPEK